MNDTNYKSIDFGALTRAGEGLTQWRALATGFLTALAIGLLVWLMQFSLMRVGGIVGVIVSVVLTIAAFVVWSGGFSAVGVLLMDKARELPQRSIGEAAMFGLASVPKFLLLGVAVFVAVLAFMLVAALLYFVCKIPLLGAVLAFVVHPVLVLVAAVAIIACVWVIFPLFAPAVWSGLSFKNALASVFAIARNRLVQVVLMMMVLYIILAVIGTLIMSGMFPATMSLTGLASSVMGGGGSVDYGNYGGGRGGLASAMSALNSASMMGAMLGMSVLGILIFAMVALVAMMGMNLLYLQASAGLDTAGTESDIEGAFGAMKEKAREAADKAKAAAERAKQAAADRVQAAATAREETAKEQARLQDEETQRQLQQQEVQQQDAARAVAEHEAAARAAAEREAQEAQARAEALRQAAMRAAAQDVASVPSVPPVSSAPSAPSASVNAGAAALGSLAAGAAASAAGFAETSASTKDCKTCGHKIGIADLFCENCGTKQ